jgi:hypothetical protein
MKYLSPLKFALEIPMVEEFKDSWQGQYVIGLFDYNFGIANCRYVVIGYLVGAKILAYISFVWQTRKFI